jgi:hypothetical protein
MVVAAPFAYMAMFSGFHAYDDEGYFLILLRDYLSGQPLLSPATPVYGPFFFETMAAVFKLLGLAPSHDAGRFVTAVVWLLSSLLAGVAVFRMTRNLWLAVGAELLAFQSLVALTNEPMSPQGLIALLLAALVTTATFRAERPHLSAALIGGMVAALCLIKINVGFFAGVAVLVAWATGLPDRYRRFVMPGAITAIVALPFAVTSTLLDNAWAAEFAFVVALAAGALGVVMLGSRPGTAPRADAVWIVLGAVVLAVVCLGIAIAGGTSIGDIWNGLILVSLRVPRVFIAPLDLSVAVDAIAVLSFAAAILVARASAPARLSAAVRATVGLSVWVALLLVPTTVFLFTLPAAWVAAVRPGDEAADMVGPYARVLVPLLVVINTLQTYPVAGTQLSLAAEPQVFVGAICLGDAWWMARRKAPVRPFAAVMVRAAAVLAGLAFLVNAPFIAGAYQTDVPLGLAGAQSMRMPANRSADLRAVVAAIDQRCATFITYPGMNSFYVWSGKKPPTEVRSENWMITFDAGQQQSLVDRLAGVPGLCVVKNQRQVEFWTRGQPVADRPLIRYIDDAFTVAAVSGDYQVLVRRTT